MLKNKFFQNLLDSSKKCNFLIEVLKLITRLKPKTIGLVSRCTLSTLKDYVSYTFTNTPHPPLNNVPTKGFSI